MRKSNSKVLIPKELFMELVKYHVAEIPCNKDFIKSELSKKLEALAASENYKTNHLVDDKK